jgi:GTP cyclohydrolase I
MDKYYMTWDEVSIRAKQTTIRILQHFEEQPPEIRIYGIPRGGVYVAAMVCGGTLKAVTKPEEADCFVDDIIDSGKTADRYRKMYGKPTFPLVFPRVREEDKNLGWIVFPWEVMVGEGYGPTDAVLRLLEYIGEDVFREGLVKTPGRYVRALEEMTSGYKMNAKEILSAQFENETDEMVMLSDIRFTSLCEHHILPFAGSVTIGYIPGKKIVGISKLARVVEMFSRRLQIQERMTQNIACAIEIELKPQGVGVVVRAHHECMSCRGVKQPGTVMVTSCMLGVMRDKGPARAEFFSLAGGK